MNGSGEQKFSRCEDCNAKRLCSQWRMLIRVQALAARFPEMGLSPDKLAFLSLDDLLGVAAFLERKLVEQEG